ncbi:MAG: aspartate--tRNA ligase [Chitinophagales bacterium]|nr:aspartate--tRNA ligase [Chitinophagales bacterium]MCO5280791.1 aspartate--tRNA ligase [Chitinophagales bacterium]OJV25134.1 MAG: aspartate--tRNA ligase [Bacteroidetes bacterium 37-13]HRP39527.1 aspartate--tRNA ligase [Chitinophagales bacterium]
MFRTNTCGELRIEHISNQVTLAGWVQRVRKLGALTFVDLRDRFGITQLAFNTESNPELTERANKLSREFVIQAKGNVAERSSKNTNIPTGEIEILVDEFSILNEAELPPFMIENDTDGSEELRLKYRYLDIRRPKLKDILLTRARIVKSVRAYLDAKDFCEIETPTFIKSTPEGARDFLVPSRLVQGSFYALPQSPQILKQLLMVAGMDKYYQVVKCFRDEDFRGDRQPEFTQIDCEMSFVHQEDILNNFEGMIQHVFKQNLNYELGEIPRLTYHTAMKLYGSDKPDLRFDCKIVELNDLLPASEFGVFNNTISSGGLVAGINAKGCAAFSRKQLDELTEFVKVAHRGLGGLVNIRFNEDGSVKSSIDKFFTEAQLREFGNAFGAEKGDLILIAADKISKVRKSLGDLRLHLAKQNNWIDESKWSVLWIVDFPLFELDEETGETIFVHHPFCSPNPEDMQYFDSEPLKVRAQQYDMVMNGNEICSGSIRITNRDLQKRVFQKLGMSEAEQQSRFGFMLDAYKYGAPPHGGCAFGLDRMVMLMTGGETIRDVIAFPKTSGGRDLMMDAPTTVDEKQLKELGISTISK